MWFYYNVMRPKDAGKMKNSVDIYTVCRDLYIWNLGSLRYAVSPITNKIP